MLPQVHGNSVPIPYDEVAVLASRVGITPEELTLDALAIMKVIIGGGLYGPTGRLQSVAPIMWAVGFWQAIINAEATGYISLKTKHGRRAFMMPEKAFRSWQR